MDWPRPQILRKDGVLNSYYPPPPPPPPSAAKISPAVLFIIVILAVLFFISGLLHLLVRFLTKHPNSSSAAGDGHQEDISTSEALQRQLQQLFNLHDSGLDQAFIDALPVFSYAEIVGPKEPFDCAVCLCEFSDKDKLRLLPTCSHAFHLNCIDTWLLSNSTCPLCRATLFAPGAPLDNPIFEYDEFPFEEDEETGKGVLSVRLGKFKRSDGGSDAPDVSVEASNSSLDARRCYSMGSYQYVVGNTNLRVALCPPDRRPEIKKVANGSNSPAGAELEGKRISSVCKGDSYSVSKIWLWQKKGGLPSSSGDSRIDLPSLGNDFSWTGTSSNA